ncbi:MAG: glycosyltransferase family 4 protein, partial [Thermoplasmatota archaeon]
NVTFVLVGRHADNSIEYLKSIAPPNVEFTNFVSDKELLEWYQRAKIYCQLSRYEGLPNTLCEAMLCECVPVGTKYCGIPTAIGNTGFYVPYGDEKATAEAIKKALNAPEELRKKAKERIIEQFPAKGINNDI